MRVLLTIIFLFTMVGCSSGPKETGKTNEETKQESKLLQMTTQAQQHVGLRTTRVALKELQEYLHVVGTVQAIDTRIGHVRPLTRGRVEKVDVRVGDRVRAGQALATFDNIEAGEVLAEYQGAVTELQRLKLQQASAQRIAERNNELSDLGAIAKKNAELSRVEAQSAQDSVRVQESVVAGLVSRLRRFGVEQVNVSNPSTVIRAPFAGVVIKAQTAPGDVFDADRELFSIADLSHVWVQAEVYEQDLGRVKVGQPAVITVDTYPGERFQGQVTYLGDILDPQTRTARVRCEVANPEIRLKLDMFASIELPTHFSRRALVVPASAIQDLNGNSVVFIRKTATSFEVRPVKTGKTLEEETEIQSGLQEGEQVVSVGSFHLKSVALSGQIGEEE
ncbi:MAG TPA: efflux RND transporter periplasmic adaptor subunit [Bryobacteraceae bacterium]|jgi:cobalt-zinc-cadmium efflux system membrane fusion protein|nr:efflux RND transporter periplasmic adaptor subunit [Bryobacteraceae bacterium]